MASANSNVVSIYGHAQQKNEFNSAQAANITAAVKSIATMHLTVLLRSMFANIDDMLFESLVSESSAGVKKVGVNKAIVDISQEDFHSLRMKYKQVELSFIKRFEAMFSQSLLLSPMPIEDNSRMKSLQSFIESSDDELEVSIMLTHFAAKADKSNQAKLAKTQSGFNNVLDNFSRKNGADIGFRKNPVSPSVITSAFKASAGSLDSDVVQVSILFDYFDQHVMQNIGDMYDQINTLFRKVGAIVD